MSRLSRPRLEESPQLQHILFVFRAPRPVLARNERVQGEAWNQNPSHHNHFASGKALFVSRPDDGNRREDVHLALIRDGEERAIEEIFRSDFAGDTESDTTHRSDESLGVLRAALEEDVDVETGPAESVEDSGLRAEDEVL